MSNVLSLQPTTWELLPLPNTSPTIQDLSIGDDGTIAVATSDGIYIYINGNWEQVASAGRYFLKVSVGDSQHVFAITNYSLGHYYKTREGWDVKAMAGSPIEVSGASDGTVYAIISDGTVVLYQSFIDYTSLSLSLNNISVGSEYFVYGTLNENAFRIIGGEPQWIGKGLTQVSAGSDGTVWALDGMGGVYQMSNIDDQVYWNQVEDAPPFESISVGNEFQVLGLSNNKLYRYQPEGYTPLLLKDLKDAEFGDLNMCATFSQWAYDMQPLEDLWYGTNGASVKKHLEGTPWEAQSFYYDSVTSTQAFMCYTALQKWIVIAFRGSQEAPDFFFDAVGYPYLIDIGNDRRVSLLVNVGWAQIQELVIQDLQAVCQRLGGISQVNGLYITGHSLGAALATYATYDLLASKSLNGIDPNKIRMINFASPPVGNSNFVVDYNALKIKSYRALIPNDPIKLAGDVLITRGFEHVGKLVTLPPGPGPDPANLSVLEIQLFIKSTENHLIQSYIDLITKIYLDSREIGVQALLELVKGEQEDLSK